MLDQASFWHAAWLARFSLWNGFLCTVEVAAASIVMGTALGVPGGLLLHYGPLGARIAMRLYVDLLRGIPFLVLIFACYYGSSLMAIQISPTVAGIVALTGFCTAHVCETVRGAIGSIPAGQTEAAKAIGLTPPERLLFVILPQAMRRMIAPWINTAVEMVKASSLLAIIGVADLLLTTQQVIARTYMVIPFYLLSWAIYLVINFTISQLGAYVAWRYSFVKH